MSTIPLKLPDGSILQYHGDPSLLPEITDRATGLPVPLAPARPNQLPFGTPLPLPSLSGSDSQQPSLWSQILGAANEQFGPSIFGKTMGPTASDPNAKFPGIVDVVAVLAGLILIAGAIWGFDNVRETTINIARRGAEVAAV